MIREAIGYTAIIEQYSLSVIPHYRQSYVSLNNQRYIHIDDKQQETHIYPKKYAVRNPRNPFHQLEFALKYDGINLEILLAIFNLLDITEIETNIMQHPTSKYGRILWFLYEFLTEKKLNIPDAQRLKYVNILDPEHYFTTTGTRSPRHRVNNNLIGTKDFSPILRRTKILIDHIDAQYEKKARALAQKYDPQTIARAGHYLYTKETLSSYKIEHEKPTQERMNKFIELLKKAPSIENLSKARLIELQNIIVDPRFKNDNYRTSQNYVGENIHHLPKIHYISPKPENIEDLMKGLLKLIEMIENTSFQYIHPVLAATVISFGFVFIHPFEDGNGRIHRFLIHYILSKVNYTPMGIIFPVSAVMLENILKYDNTLELFSKPLLEKITKYNLSDEGALTVTQSTHNYYKYIDYTKMAEYLFECINTTIDTHFKNEIEFLVNYDHTKHQIQNIVDMPDKLIDLFIKFSMQNNGKLAVQKREKYFNKLTEHEIERIQFIIKSNMLKNEST